MHIDASGNISERLVIMKFMRDLRTSTAVSILTIRPSVNVNDASHTTTIKKNIMKSDHGLRLAPADYHQRSHVKSSGVDKHTRILRAPSVRVHE